MDAQAAQLLRERTSLALDWLEADLVALKAAAGTTVTVILPALNEEATVATIVRQIRRELMSAASTNLVDELVVLDSGSTDRTAKVAADAGATVIHRDDVLADLPTVPGRAKPCGVELLQHLGISWSSSTPISIFSTSYVVGLVGPLLTDPQVQLVKAVYERPSSATDRSSAGGGRVTEQWPDPC